MKNVWKNIFKYVAYCSLILLIIYTIFYSIYAIQLNKYTTTPNNAFEVVQNGIEDGRNCSEIDTEIYSVAEFVSEYAQFEILIRVVVISIFIGATIGIAYSLKENSKLRLFAIYATGYIIVASLAILSELLPNGLDTYNALGLALELLVIYTTIFIAVRISVKLKAKEKIKKLNKELENNKY